MDDRAVALDLRNDRYFLIAAVEASALRTAGNAAGGPINGAGINALVRRCLVGTGAGPAIAPVVAEPLTRSAIEMEATSRRIALPEIALIRAQASLSLRFLRLRRTLARWQRLRLRYRSRKPPQDVELAAMQIAQGFADARLLLPAKTLCVPDSLTLACILWRRGIDADVYFGVRLAPFLAHAWVQRGDMLLSDTLNTVGEYTPVFRL
ncbi:lasso peptide biosynthesis B2 protein [Sphingopyxis sp. R3-92]|uniref:lasso peptide biosynthesis B2 protein n=1 Tax=Sphingopyxis sp. R3-92 TaxID=3158553 RepID=UPI003EE66E46